MKSARPAELNQKNHSFDRLECREAIGNIFGVGSATRRRSPAHCEITNDKSIVRLVSRYGVVHFGRCQLSAHDLRSKYVTSSSVVPYVPMAGGRCVPSRSAAIGTERRWRHSRQLRRTHWPRGFTSFPQPDVTVSATGWTECIGGSRGRRPFEFRPASASPAPSSFVHATGHSVSGRRLLLCEM